MKKVLMLAAVFTLVICMHVYADPLAEFDTENGHMIIQRYEIAKEGSHTYLYLIFDWTNTGDDPNSPLLECLWEAYQNGKQINEDIGFDYTPDGTDGYGGTNVMTGVTTTGYTGFDLFDNSIVDIRVKSFWGDVSASFTIDPSDYVSDANEDAPAPETTASNDDIIAQLEQRISDLEARVDALEGK